MINTKQVVPALVAVTLLSLAPAAEALAIEEHAQAAKPAAMAADKPAAAKPAEAKADTKKDAKADVKTQAPAATDPAKETPGPSVEQAQKAYDNGSYEEAFIIVEPLAKLEAPRRRIPARPDVRTGPRGKEGVRNKPSRCSPPPPIRAMPPLRPSLDSSIWKVKKITPQP